MNQIRSIKFAGFGAAHSEGTIYFDKKITCVTGTNKSDLVSFMKFVQLVCNIGFGRASNVYKIHTFHFDAGFIFSSRPENNEIHFGLEVTGDGTRIHESIWHYTDDGPHSIMDYCNQVGTFNGKFVPDELVQNGQLALSAHGCFNNNIASDVVHYFNAIHDINSSDYSHIYYERLPYYFNKVFQKEKATAIISHLKEENNEMCNSWSDRDKVFIRTFLPLAQNNQPSLILIDNIDFHLTFDNIQDIAFLEELAKFENQVLITAKHSSAIENINKIIQTQVIKL